MKTLKEKIQEELDANRAEGPFKEKPFPNMCSNIPASPAYGVYIS
jgi:hypothetical protein